MARSTSLRKPRKAGGSRPAPLQRRQPVEDSGAHFPVVAAGASAGGLAALTELLNGVSSTTGMAFVLIQHLEPRHESALTSILSKATAMPVVEVTQGLTVEPNHVYVIPPNKRLTMSQGALRLTPRARAGGLQHPIDDFANALAQEQGSAAIGIVLSGTGSDGTQGLKAIKAAGGITFAQDPKTAQWPAMPMSAIAAGAVDFILSPKRIAAELKRIGRLGYLAEPREAADGSGLDKICLLLRTSVGVDFRLYKQATVRRRIARRMALQKIGSLEKYAQTLRKNPEEAAALADDIFIHVTSFFRDPACFLALRNRLRIWLKRLAGDPLRIWVAGCSSGEEAYSIGMLVTEELGERIGQTKVQIFGTDIQERAVEEARAAHYSEAAVAGVTPARLKRFFEKTPHGYRVVKPLRDICVFARHDLSKDPPFSRLDLISCRNVLIYMGPVLQKRILAAFQYALKPGGLLMLGTSESINEYSDAFAPVDRQHRIFSRKPIATRFHGFDPAAVAPRLASSGPAARPSQADGSVDFRAEAEAALLQHFTPPALVVDSDLHIVHFQGDTSPYLAPATGQPSFHLLKMIRPEFLMELRAALLKVRKGLETVHVESVSFEQDGKAALVRLEVRPLERRNGRKRDFLVVFQRSEPVSLPQAAGSSAPGKASAEKTAKLEREVASAREHLRRLLSEHETAQEEMKAANEEILSSNEELQSTNEELETAKEELQSSNEELLTLNEELQNRNAELGVLTQDLNSLLAGLDLPVLVLDAGLRVRRFTPSAGTLLNLIPGDVGRPFTNIASNLDVDNWPELLATVAAGGHSVARKVKDRNGHHFSLRMRPFKAGPAELKGVLVVLLDVDTLEHSLAAAEESQHLAQEAGHRSEAILNSLAAHVAVITHDGTIVATNDTWNNFAVDNGCEDLARAGPGANYLEVCRAAGEGDGTSARAALEGIGGVLDGSRASFALEYPCHTPSQQRWFDMSVLPLKGSAGAVITHRNITDRKLAEIATQKSESLIRALLDSSLQGILAVDAAERITMVNKATETMFGYGPGELLGQLIEILVPEGSRARHAEFHRIYFSNMKTRPMGAGLDLEARRKDGSVFPVEVALGAVNLRNGKLAVAFVNDITERKRLERNSELHRKQIRELAARLMTVQEEERHRVSRELHDQICQQLASLAIDIGAMVADPQSRKGTAERLKDLQSRVVKTSEEARHIAYELHPSVLDDLGLVASLRALCQDGASDGAVNIEFSSTPLPGPIPRAIASCLYRVAQEALQNIRRHSRAENAKVSIGGTPQGLLLTIDDDGTGFNPEEVRGQGGLGLVGIEERVRLVNGTLKLATSPGGGTRIAVEIPLNGEAGDEADTDSSGR